METWCCSRNFVEAIQEKCLQCFFNTLQFWCNWCCSSISANLLRGRHCCFLTCSRFSRCPHNSNMPVAATDWSEPQWFDHKCRTWSLARWMLSLCERPHKLSSLLPNAYKHTSMCKICGVALQFLGLLHWLNFSAPEVVLLHWTSGWGDLSACCKALSWLYYKMECMYYYVNDEQGLSERQGRSCGDRLGQKDPIQLS